MIKKRESMPKELTSKGQATFPKKEHSLSTARLIRGLLESKEHHTDEEIKLVKRPNKKFGK
jgi:hypothetical protein